MFFIAIEFIMFEVTERTPKGLTVSRKIEKYLAVRRKKVNRKKVLSNHKGRKSIVSYNMAEMLTVSPKSHHPNENNC